MRNLPEIKIFLSSPADVSKERDIVKAIVSEINNDRINHNYSIKLYRWEDNFISDWGSYQEIINKELDDTDIFIGLLWNRFGSPTKKFSSGTEEEFESAYKLKENGKKFELSFFKCTRKKTIKPNEKKALQQKKKVDEFFRHKNNNIFSSTNYSKYDEFKQKCKDAISSKIINILQRNLSIEDIMQCFTKNGITKIYTHELNNKRNEDKINFLKIEEGNIYLLAHTGNSYLHTSEGGHPGRFFDEVKNRLKTKPGRLNVILLNPFSLEARKIFYAENFNKYQNDITSIKNVEYIKNGNNYQRFEKCLIGIEQLKRELDSDHNKIEVRITNVATDGTILMSDKRLFFEPYLSSRFLNRIEKGLNVFEIQVENQLKEKQCPPIANEDICMKCVHKEICSINLYKTISEQFHILWESAISLPEFKGHTERYIQDFEDVQPELFNKQLLQLHDSWYAFDPIIGCAGMCVYCFLGPQGWKNSTPRLRKKIYQSSEEFLYEAFKSFDKFEFFTTRKNKFLCDIPISIGNKTDMFYSKNIPYLFNILDLHKQTNPIRPIVLITKQLIKEETIDKLGNYPFKVIIFYSISFLPSEFEPGVSDYETRLNSAKQNKKFIDEKGIKNIKLIHYWRPVIINRTEKIRYFMSCVKEIFECSVCIGLKINNEILNFSNHERNILTDYIDEKQILDIENSKEIFEPPFSELSSISQELKYPIFQHTSCAISSINLSADYNGSMWRENFCDNCNQSQFEICTQFKKVWQNEDNFLLFQNKFANKYIIKENYIELINTTLSQQEINYWTHLIGKPVYSDSIRFSLVWPSGNQNYIYNKKAMHKEIFEIVKSDYPTLTMALERLKGITGFISIIGPDERVYVFNRYNHVNRVIRLLKWYINDLKDINLEKCAFLGLYHDLNRLPFAHNLEKHIGFSQADTIGDFLKIHGVVINQSYIDDLKAFFNKELDFSVESRIAYLIDAVSGFIEDPLFAFCTLNLDFRKINQEILKALGFSDTAKLKTDVEKLSKIFKSSPGAFTKNFDNIVFDYAKSFINLHQNDKIKIFDNDWFIKTRDRIKQQLMVEQIFPLNNEKISKGRLFSEEIAKPYLEKIKISGTIPWDRLFKQKDIDFMDNAIEQGIILAERTKEFYPNLNISIINNL